MRKLMKKKVNVFGKTIPVFVIALLSMAVVSAALLSYFGMITGIFTVTQAVSATTISNSFANVAGESVIDCGTGGGYSVKNNADVEIPIQFGTTCRNVEGFDDGMPT